MTQYLYLVHCKTETLPNDNLYKIGVANDVESRLAQLQTGSPFELVIEECYELDGAEIAKRAIHQAYAKMHVRGEWFSLGGSAVADFQTLCEMLGGRVFVPDNYKVTPDAVESAEEEQEIILGGINWRLERRNDRNPPGFAIFQRGGEKVYLGYIGKRTLKDPEHPTVEEIEAAIKRNGSNGEQP